LDCEGKERKELPLPPYLSKDFHRYFNFNQVTTKGKKRAADQRHRGQGRGQSADEVQESKEKRDLPMPLRRKGKKQHGLVQPARKLKKEQKGEKKTEEEKKRGMKESPHGKGKKRFFTLGAGMLATTPALRKGRLLWPNAPGLAGTSVIRDRHKRNDLVPSAFPQKNWL